MRTHPMSHDAAEALLRGAVPADRPDLAPLASAIAEFRGAAYATPPRPSAELRARLELAGASEISFAAVPTRSSAATVRHHLTATRSPALGGVRRALGWFAGLGIAAQVIVGVSVAAAVGVTGVGTVAGVSGIVAAVTSGGDSIAPDERDMTEPGGTVVPDDERPGDDEPASTTEGSETTSPAPVEESETADDPDPTDTADPGSSPPEPSDSEAADSGNNADSGSNGVGNPGTGNDGNSGGNGNAGSKGNPGNDGHQGNGNKNSNGNNGDGN